MADTKVWDRQVTGHKSDRPPWRAWGHVPRDHWSRSQPVLSRGLSALQARCPGRPWPCTHLLAWADFLDRSYFCQGPLVGHNDIGATTMIHQCHAVNQKRKPNFLNEAGRPSGPSVATYLLGRRNLIVAGHEQKQSKRWASLFRRLLCSPCS